ncbi:cytochrome P450 family protein [Ceratobasidium sp. AG-Ba]|nr:cytochrome P450 family protein [Ceratobasidium sp. AG-Ba]
MDPSLPPGAIFASCILVLTWWYWTAPSIPLPPRVRGNIIFGSALELRNSKAFWLTFAKYNEQHGPIVTARMLHQNMILVDDPRIATDLFEKKAAQYSDRYVSEVAKLGGWDHDIIFMGYNPTLKYYRTLLQRALNNRVSLDYVPLQEYEVRRYMRRLVETPEKFMKHIHLLSASIAIRMVYGYKVDSADDRFVQAAEEVMAVFADVLSPGRWMVEVFPLLRYLPAWFPFTIIKRKIRVWQKSIDTYENDTFDYVLDQLAAGKAENSFTAKLLQPEDGEVIDEEKKHHIKVLASSLYGAGADTTVSAIQSFFLAMTLYPDVQAKAQTEIANYFQERFSEILRWHPVLNLVGRRATGKDDDNVVVGDKIYRIPAYTHVIVNTWKIFHDPKVYDQPDRFMPERYLTSNPPPDPAAHAFGYGRRMCPGSHVAQQTMWLAVSNTLANFSISKAKDENGVEIVPSETYTNDIISHPVPFECSIKPCEGRETWIRDEGA